LFTITAEIRRRRVFWVAATYGGVIVSFIDGATLVALGMKNSPLAGYRD